VRWCPDGDFWRLFCVLYLQRAASSTFQSCILNSHYSHAMCRSMVDIHSVARHGRRSVGGLGDMSPLLFEVEGTPCILSPLLSGVDVFCNAQLHSNNCSLQFIWWMLTPLGPNRRVPFHVIITIYDNDVNVMSPLCSFVAPQTLYIWYNRNRQVDN